MHQPRVTLVSEGNFAKGVRDRGTRPMSKQGINTRMWRLAATIVAICLMSGCTGGGQQMRVEPRADILRIGVSTNYPPLIFKQEDRVVGVEADLGSALAARLGKEPVFVEVPWHDQVNQLISGGTDIIMAGMSVTEDRLYKINFSRAYFKTGQMALVGNRPQFKNMANFAALRAQVVVMRVGVVSDTTGEAYVMENLNMAKKIERYATSAAAVEALKNNTIDMLVYDGVAVLMLESENTRFGFKKVPLFLTDEYLAWGVAKDNAELLDAANQFLEEARANGALREILSRWIPNISDLE